MSNKIEMYRGDSYDAEITITDENGDAVDLTNAEIIFSAKKNNSNTVSFSRKNTAAGGDATEIEMSDPTNGKFKLHIVPTNTSGLAVYTYDYDIEITISTKVYTVIKDELILLEDVTR